MASNGSRSLALSVLASALIAPILACKDSSAFTAPIAPTPTPVVVDLNGAWTGHFNSYDRCDYPRFVGARATLTQEGSTVDGTLDTSEFGCGASHIVIHATLVGTSLEGTLESGSWMPFAPGSTVTGTFADPTLILELHDARGHRNPGGFMRLRR